MRSPRCSTAIIRAKPGEWIPNEEGGRENWEAVEFLRATNRRFTAAIPAFMTIAEESHRLARRHPAACMKAGPLWASASSGTWASCTTRCVTWRAIRCTARSTIDDITFGLMYAFSENFVLPLSHDEVVHGKGIAARQDERR